MKSHQQLLGDNDEWSTTVLVAYGEGHLQSLIDSKLGYVVIENQLWYSECPFNWYNQLLGHSV